jgi:hypothetical protein
VLATIFVTFPFVARELIPLMQEQGTRTRRRRCRSAPAAGRRSRRVTLPNVKWALLYGVLLCNARAMGEFGAVAVSPATSAARPTPCRCRSSSTTGVPGAAQVSLQPRRCSPGSPSSRSSSRRWLEWRYADELTGTAPRSRRRRKPMDAAVRNDMIDATLRTRHQGASAANGIGRTDGRFD